MLSFASDYIAGAHPEILKRLIDTNLENLSGYGTDEYCLQASKKIQEACGIKKGSVYFVSGGTQTNQLIISTMLDSHEGVISPSTGHISVHEAGAIEYSGHKVINLNSKNGKLESDDLLNYLQDFYNDGNNEHMTFPGMVYISFPTEYGTLYSKKELESLYNICKKYNMTFYIDGARLIYALASSECDVSLKDLSKLCDVFYIGGTKAGLLLGEAIVFTHNNAPSHFNTKIKQHGAMLAKGRVLGIQFDALFTNDLYKEIGKYAIDKANKLKNIFEKKNYKFYIDSYTNQQFIILDNKKMEELKEKVIFSFWEKYDDNNTVVRFVVSFSTTDDDLNELEKLL